MYKNTPLYTVHENNMLLKVWVDIVLQIFVLELVFQFINE